MASIRDMSPSQILEDVERIIKNSKTFDISDQDLKNLKKKWRDAKAKNKEFAELNETQRKATNELNTANALIKLKSNDLNKLTDQSKSSAKSIATSGLHARWAYEDGLLESSDSRTLPELQKDIEDANVRFAQASNKIETLEKNHQIIEGEFNESIDNLKRTLVGLDKLERILEQVEKLKKEALEKASAEASAASLSKLKPVVEKPKQDEKAKAEARARAKADAEFGTQLLHEKWKIADGIYEAKGRIKKRKSIKRNQRRQTKRNQRRQTKRRQIRQAKRR